MKSRRFLLLALLLIPPVISACAVRQTPPPVTEPATTLTPRQQIHRDTLNFVRRTDQYKTVAMQAAGTAVRLGALSPENGAIVRAKGVQADALLAKALDALEAYVRITDAAPESGQWTVQDRVATAVAAVNEIGKLLTEWKVLK